jgi:hypothetical protein
MAEVPASVGVYALYRSGVAVYVGRAIGALGLRGRLRSHLATGVDLSRSSFRRNVYDDLGVAPTEVTRMRPSAITAAQVAKVNEWVQQCEVAWAECQSAKEAFWLEVKLRREWLPTLNRR